MLKNYYEYNNYLLMNLRAARKQIRTHKRQIDEQLTEQSISTVEDNDGLIAKSATIDFDPSKKERNSPSVLVVKELFPAKLVSHFHLSDSIKQQSET